MQIKKRDGTLVPFDETRITTAVLKALTAEGLPSESVADKITKDVMVELKGVSETSVEEVQDIVERALMKRGLLAVAKAFILYRDEHARARKALHVRTKATGTKQDVTDKSMLMVQSLTSSATTAWDRQKIADKLVETLGMKKTEARSIAKEVEERLIATGLTEVSSAFIRELANNVLVEHGYAGQLKDLTMYQLPREFIDSLMFTKSNENSNIVSNNPEAVSLAVSETLLRQYALDVVFTPELRKAHMEGRIHIHDVSFPHRVYCSSHSIEYIKKYGLKGLENLNTESKPAKTASVLTGHLNTFLASMQANYAGALGLGYMNVLYAPMVEGMTAKQLHQTAQELVFNGSQNAFSRGGQSLHPDELIWVKRGGRYQSIQIGPFVDAYIDRHHDMVRRTEAYEVFNTEGEDIQAISFEKTNGSVLDKPIMYVARMPHKGKMYRVHTSNGIVNITGDHSLFKFLGKQDIRPCKASELEVNDFVVIPHKVNLAETRTTVRILDYVPEDEVSVTGFDKFAAAVSAKGNATQVLAAVGATRYIMKDGKKYNKVCISLAKHFLDIEDCDLSLKGDSQATLKNTIPLTWSLGYIAGMFCSEGYKAHKQASITNANQALLDKVKKALDDIGYKGYNHAAGMKTGGTADVVDVGGILGLFLQKSCTDGRWKIVPDWMFTAPKECIDGFLEGFYDGEGCNRKTMPDTWSVSNTSTRVVAGISLLMLDKGRETNVYETRHPNNPTWHTCYELREPRHRKVNPFRAFTTVDSYRRYKGTMNQTIRDSVEWLIASDLSVSIIKKIEEYDYDGYVYDISVPGTEAFLGGIGNVFFKNTLFLDFNIHTGVPRYLADVPAVGPGGKYMFRYTDRDPREPATVPLVERYDGNGDWTLVLQTDAGEAVVLREHDGKQEFTRRPDGHVLVYGDFQEWAQKFAHALLDVWQEGDARGRIFEFPKCDFHVNAEAFTDPGQHEVLQHACRLAAVNGSTYFVFDRDSVSLAACCRLRIQITDMSMLNHPEHLRSCGFQNVTINVPQAAYRAARAGEKNLDGLFKQIDEAMDLAMEAHLQKKAHIAKLMVKGGPLWQLGKTACDGRPYLELKDATYIIGIIGVNDAVQFLTGKQLHESDEAYDMGLKIAGHMYLRTLEYNKKYGLTVKLEESPAESAARRLAKADLVFFREEALPIYKGGDENHAYYTNSIHVVADASIDALERTDMQSKFNSIIEAGAITHLFIGEQMPSPGAIMDIVRYTFLNTQSAQITFSPEFTLCDTCGRMSRGLLPRCPYCGSYDIVGETRIVGYFSKLPNFNKSKLAENQARDRGNYRVEESMK